MLRVIGLAISISFCSFAFPCELRASWEPWAPYQYMNQRNEVTGLDNDLLLLVAETAGCSVKLEHIPWKRALKMLDAQKLDVTAGASFSKERQARFLYSKAYRSERVALFVHKTQAQTYNYDTLENLVNSNFKFGVVRGYFYGESFNKLKEEGKLIGQISEAISDEQNFKKLHSSRVDGVLSDQFVGSSVLKSMNWQNVIMRMPTFIDESGIYFIFSKSSESEAIRDRFDKAIVSLQKEGKIQRVINRYLQ